VQPQKKRALVLLSGGLDSSVCLAIAVGAFGEENVRALSLSYGQKHEREVGAAKDVSTYYGVPHEVVTLDPGIFRGQGSTLTDPDAPLPKMTYEELQESFGVSPTYVPFRNGNLLSVAAALALRHQVGYIYAGMHAEDARNWAYPDCTPEFLGAMANAIYVGTYHKVRLVTPLAWMTKADVVRKGASMKLPFALTWSCYAGGPAPCGTCPTCISRAAAFAEAGVEDGGR